MRPSNSSRLPPTKQVALLPTTDPGELKLAYAAAAAAAASETDPNKAAAAYTAGGLAAGGLAARGLAARLEAADVGAVLVCKVQRLLLGRRPPTARWSVRESDASADYARLPVCPPLLFQRHCARC